MTHRTAWHLAGAVLVSSAAIAASSLPAFAAGREVPGLTRGAFARACEASGGTIEEGLAGAANALVCKLPNGTEITCGFAEQPPMCVWRETPPTGPLHDIFGDIPDTVEQRDPPKGLTSGDSAPTTAAPPSSGGKGSNSAPGAGGGQGSMDPGQNPVVK